MEPSGTSRRVVAAAERPRRVHNRRISAKQRLHLAALLIVTAIAAPAHAQSDIAFDPAITQSEFSEFSRLLGQAIYASPVEPARARGVFGFDVGVAATAVPVDPNAGYWTRAVQDDFTVSDHVAVPRLVASKGLSFATVSGTYSRVPQSDVAVWGGSLDVPLLRGGIATPTLALRGAYAQLRGIEEYELSTYGVELFLSKGFGPVTPYIAAGRARTDAEGRTAGTTTVPPMTLTDESDVNRFTAGVRLSLLIPKITVEATQAETRSYAAKVSFGF